MAPKRLLQSFAATLALLLLAAHPASANPIVEVPREMEYCGIWLTFTPAARQKIQEYVNQYTKNYVSYRAMVDRAATYLPFIRDGFSVVGVPSDLAYIAIQESGLRGGAVSTSNAVGFWQMKDFTAREVGLRVDEWIDERKHIFRASIGAARYFLKNGQRYNNWLYAIISYYEGGTGARPYTQERYIGANEMEIDASCHWYALKAIAHKLAYEDAIRSVDRPTVYLAPFSSEGELDLAQLAARHGLSLEKFREHNLWCSGTTLPPDRPFSYHVPAEDRSLAQVDPLRHLWATSPTYAAVVNPNLPPSSPDRFAQASATQTPTSGPAPTLADAQTVPVRERSTERPVADIRAHVIPAPPVPRDAIRYPIVKEEMLNIDFVVVREGETLERIANRTLIPVEKLRRWNHLYGNQQPAVGSLVAIRKPRKTTVHVARDRETLVDVAMRYRRNPRKLAYQNRLTNIDQLLLPGQKVYLVGRRPHNQPIILYSVPDSVIGRAPQRAAAPASRSTASSPAPSTSAAAVGTGTANPATANPSGSPAARAPASNPSTSSPAPSTSAPTPGAATANPATANPSGSPAARAPASNPSTSSPAPSTSAPTPGAATANPATASPSGSPATRAAASNPSTSSPAPSTSAPTAGAATANPATANPSGSPAARAAFPVQQTREEELLMPAPEPAPQASAASPQAQAAAQPNAEEGLHTVAPGETLYTLSRRFGVTVEQLQQWNQLSGTSLAIGQRIRVRQP
jgi:membrane-bound lytic murein transglycosylase D